MAEEQKNKNSLKADSEVSKEDKKIVSSKNQKRQDLTWVAVGILGILIIWLLSYLVYK
jgi:predicted nucleic acid-binding Zn ribbon protein